MKGLEGSRLRIAYSAAGGMEDWLPVGFESLHATNIDSVDSVRGTLLSRVHTMADCVTAELGGFFGRLGSQPGAITG